MVHIAAASKLLTQRYVQGMEVEPNTPDASKMDKAAILKLLQSSFNYTKEIVQTINQKQLDETCKMYHSGNTVSRAFALFYVQDHIANHRAKANLYLRINGVEPPEYTWGLYSKMLVYFSLFPKSSVAAKIASSLAR